MDSVGTAVGAKEVVELLIHCGVTHVVWLVDSESAFLYEALHAAEDGGRLRVVPVCREGETIPLALGLLLGGKRPVIIIQSTGFFEAGDSLRGQAIDFGLPLVFFIGYRGWKPNREQMHDTAAIYLEPVLQAYGVPYYILRRDNYRALIPQAFQEAEQRHGPVALLTTAEWEA